MVAKQAWCGQKHFTRVYSEGGKTYALKAKDQNQHGDAGDAVDEGRCEAEDEAETQVDGEDVAGLEGADGHEAAG